nr:MAG TPA: hypothetical protein [Caudoviricetes sp.]
MFEFLKLQYRMGKIDGSRLQSYVPRWISQEQADEIMGVQDGE